MRAYVVWVPVLLWPGVEGAAHREAGRVSDTRATHFADTEGILTRAYSPVLKLAPKQPAWDVYMAFGPKVRWEDKPPVPTYWMHQLGRSAPRELWLDGDRMAGVVNQELARR